MLKKTSYQVPKDLIEQALKELPSDEFRYTINRPLGNFFYDSWEIRPEFKDTVWHKILNSLPNNIGESRIIILEPGKCYQAHSDIDDRYHLNLYTDESYLIDLENNELHKLNSDGVWYDMDAGRRHTAMNVGRQTRIQLVVRHLLKNNNLNDPINIRIISEGITADHARFLFDQCISPLLNRFNKVGIINGFEYQKEFVRFNIEQDFLKTLKQVLPQYFRIEQ